MGTLSRLQARRLATHCQLLDRSSASASGVEGVYQAIRHPGYVQIDTISVVDTEEVIKLRVEYSVKSYDNVVMLGDKGCGKKSKAAKKPKLT